MPLPCSIIPEQPSMTPTHCPPQTECCSAADLPVGCTLFYHSGGEVNNHLSLYYPKPWNIAWIYSFPDAFNCPRSRRIHQADHMGGSCKAASSINKQKDFSHSDCMTIKTGSTLNTDGHEQCPRALAMPALTVTQLQVLYPRQIETHWNTTAAAAPCSTIPLLCQDSQQARWPSSG